jgi:ABC-2 type transport system permease protein
MSRLHATCPFATKRDFAARTRATARAVTAGRLAPEEGPAFAAERAQAVHRPSPSCRTSSVSVRASVRALPTILRVGFAEALAYRAETAVWIAATTMPLVMLALWHTVAREAPIGRFGAPQMVGYFLSMFIVRQLTGSWAVWLINMEVRDGTLAQRLLRPVHPLLSYAISAFAELPVRSFFAVPAASAALLIFAGDELTRSPAMWALWLASIVGGWLITLFANFAIGCLALFVESSTKLMDVWLALYFVFSGYLFPVELFPPAMRRAVDWLPFRYQLGLPVEIMTGTYDVHGALAMLARQWLMVGLMLAVVTIVWRGGVKRFAAFGG